MTAAGDTELRPDTGTTAGQWVLRACVAAHLAYVAVALWLLLPLPGDTSAAKLAGVLLPVSVTAMVPFIYLTFVPGVAKIRWALKNAGGSSADYARYRAETDAAAVTRAGNPVTRWIIHLRKGVW